MPRLGVFEHKPINITSLAVPDVEVQRGNYFFKELKKIEPKLEQAFAQVRDTISISELPSFLWAGATLFDWVTPTSDERERMVAYIDRFRTITHLGGGDYWYMAFVKLISYTVTFRQEQRTVLLDYIRRSDPTATGLAGLSIDLLHTLAAATVLSPGDVKHVIKDLGQFESIFHNLLKDYLRTNTPFETCIPLMFAFRLLFPEEKLSLDKSQVDELIDTLEIFLLGSPSMRADAIWLVAQAKLALADEVVRDGGGSIKVVYGPLGSGEGESTESGQPPTQRSF